MKTLTIAVSTVLPRCGDQVIHRPSGETWTVAFADKDVLAPAGWPDNRAQLSDCEIIVRCSDKEHAAQVAQWSMTTGPDTRRSSVLRLYGYILQPEESTPEPDLNKAEARVLAFVDQSPTGRPLPFGSGTYAGVTKERNTMKRCLINQARMLAGWGAECFPAAENGQVHFARALMESAAKEMSDAAGVDYPEPAESPAAGVVALLERLHHALTCFNGLFAMDLSVVDLQMTAPIDTMPELIEIDAVLARLRGPRI